MSKYTDRAVELFKSGFNCSQAVFAAFSEKIGMDEQTALRVSAGLGGGVGRRREVCGAVSGAAMLAGMVYGARDGEDREAKAKMRPVAAMSQQVRTHFFFSDKGKHKKAVYRNRFTLLLGGKHT